MPKGLGCFPEKILLAGQKKVERMEITSSVQSNPALSLLHAVLQAVNLENPEAQQPRDTVNISKTAKQLAQADPSQNS